jgi:4-carboxymuconolactone decarboxylase
LRDAVEQIGYTSTHAIQERSRPMECKLLYAGMMGLLLMGLALAQDAQPPGPRNIQLRGDRFQPLTYDQLTPPQKDMVDHILAGPRGSLDGPYNMLLRSPEMGDLAQQFGASMRYQSSLPPRLNEFAIMITARAWTAQHAWAVHKQTALRAGLSPEICDALANGRRPPFMQPDEEAVYNFATELIDTRQVSDAAFAAVKEKFGERGVVDLVGVLGYYQFVSMVLNVDRYPVAPGTQPELKPLN